MSLAKQIEQWTLTENVAQRLDDWFTPEEGCDPTMDEIIGDVHLLEQQHTWLMKRVKDLEDFALEALNHLNMHAFQVESPYPEIQAALLKDAQDFTARHNDDGMWVLDNIQTNPEYVDWGGDG